MVNLFKAWRIILRLINESPNLWQEYIRKQEHKILKLIISLMKVLCQSQSTETVTQYKAYKNIPIIVLKSLLRKFKYKVGLFV